MTWLLRRRAALLALALAVGVVAGLAAPARAGAHGEHSQEGFLRMRTIAWVDVHFGKDGAELAEHAQLRRGDQVVISGRFRVLEAWPAQLRELPSPAFLNVAAFGSRYVVEERWVNGEFTPGSFMIDKGRTYDFRMVLRARVEGEAHVHPVVNVRGVGPIVGPGRWLDVQGGSFENEVTLWNGETANLETFGLGRIIGWHAAAAALGGVWALFWVVRPLVRRMVALRTGGPEAEARLISRRDMLVGAALLVVIGAVIIAGWATTRAKYETIPLQVIVVDPPPLPEPPKLVEVRALQSRYNPLNGVLLMDAEVANVSAEPVRLEQFVAAYLEFRNPAAGDAAPAHRLQVSPSDMLAPGERRTLQLRMADRAWEAEHLMELAQPQLRVAGVLVVRSVSGVENLVAVSPPALFPDYSLQ